MPNIPFPQCILVVTGTGKTKGEERYVFADPVTKVISRLSSRLGITCKAERKQVKKLV